MQRDLWCKHKAGCGTVGPWVGSREMQGGQPPRPDLCEANVHVGQLQLGNTEGQWVQQGRLA